MSVWTGTRVPANTTVPPRTFSDRSSGESMGDKRTPSPRRLSPSRCSVNPRCLLDPPRPPWRLGKRGPEQTRERALQAAAHRRHGDARALRDLARVEPFVEAQQHRRPVRLLEREHRVGHAPQRLGPGELLVDRFQPLRPRNRRLTPSPTVSRAPVAPREPLDERLPSHARGFAPCRGGRSSAASHVSWTTSAAAWASATRLRASERTKAACSARVWGVGLMERLVQPTHARDRRG